MGTPPWRDSLLKFTIKVERCHQDHIQPARSVKRGHYARGPGRRLRGSVPVISHPSFASRCMTAPRTACRMGKLRPQWAGAALIHDPGDILSRSRPVLDREHIGHTGERRRPGPARPDRSRPLGQPERSLLWPPLQLHDLRRRASVGRSYENRRTTAGAGQAQARSEALAASFGGACAAGGGRRVLRARRVLRGGVGFCGAASGSAGRAQRVPPVLRGVRRGSSRACAGSPAGRPFLSVFEDPARG